MQNFIVLGYVPGTNYQTTLNFWLTVSAVFSIWLFRATIRSAYSSLQRYLVIRQIAHAINMLEPVTV